MTRIRAHLLDGDERPLRTIEVENGDAYAVHGDYVVNGYFKTEDDELWLIAEVTPGSPPIDFEITCVYIGAPS